MKLKCRRPDCGSTFETARPKFRPGDTAILIGAGWGRRGTHEGLWWYCPRHVDDTVTPADTPLVKRRSPVTISSEEVAVAELKLGGYAPGEPYPGRASALWKVVCVACGAQRTVRLKQVRSGERVCKHTAPRSKGDESPEEREHRERERTRELERAGFKALEPPPLRVSVLMRVECLLCGSPRKMSIAMVRSGRRCAHTKPRRQGG